MAEWPKALQPAQGPWREDKLDGAAAGMGDWGNATRQLAAAGWVPPDMLTGLTLYLLSNQPRDPARQKIPGGGGGVAGGVWVRERFTIHRPLARADAFTVTGEAVGRYVHKGRRYSTTRSLTKNAAGDVIAANLTTGLLAYRVQEGLADGVEGVDPATLDAPQTAAARAAHNPSLEALRGLDEGARLGGERVLVSLGLMAARDTQKPDNPIHSDPELARKAGLSRPIAGGSHVLAFALEPILAAAGPEALLHGAAFDLRWKAPVYADSGLTPTVEVAAVDAQCIAFDLQASLDDGATAMTGRVTVPLP